MKVKEIIKFTEWLPNSKKSDRAPRFSIMMPTYRRFASGHLTRAIQSVLDQSYDDFELVMIDDGSVDGSFDEIKRFMELDARIHCLHHPYNVGLPALGCYEAFRKSRSEYSMFCFDDTEYQKTALANVDQYISEHKPKIAFGYIDAHYKDLYGHLAHVYVGKEKISQAYLKMTNFLPNLGAILHRSVPFELGFLDPHFAIARLTDWDYWKRAATKYELHYSDLHIGTEFGLVTGNSLGLTYPLNPWMAYEWTEQERDTALIPGNFEEYDIQVIPKKLSDQSQRVLHEMSRFYADKFWYQPQKPLAVSAITEQTAEPMRNARVIIVTPAQSASVTLPFEFIPNPSQTIRYVSPSYHRPEEMISANAVIFVRELFHPRLHRWIEVARKLGIPHYYYLDENFLVLHKENPELSVFTVDNVRKELATFRGVLASSQALADFFAENTIHPHVYYFPPIKPPAQWLDNASLPEKAAGAIRIGFMGAPHRHKELVERVLPAMRRLANDWPVELVIGGEDKIDPNHYPEIKIYQFPFNMSYRLALGRMQSANIGILVHAGSETRNNQYKTHNTLLNAWALKALPILANQPPYEEVEQRGLGFLCSSTDEWYEKLSRAVSDPVLAAQVQENLHQYVMENFSGKQNLTILNLIARENPVPGLFLIDHRYRLYINILRRDVYAPADAGLKVGGSHTRLAALIRRIRSWLLPSNSKRAAWLASW